MVGIEARMRESSVTLPSASGTLKSTRTKTRLPVTSASRTVSLSMSGRAFRAAPLPQPPVGPRGAPRIGDRRARVAPEVRRHEGLLGHAEDAGHGAGGGGAE